jgi:hypothetical protein
MSLNAARRPLSVAPSLAADLLQQRLGVGFGLVQIGVRQKPMRGAARSRAIGTGGSASTAPRNSAISSSVRAIRPSVSDRVALHLDADPREVAEVGL